MRTVRLATFSVVGSSTVSLRQPFQSKLIVKYDSTTDSENYGGKMGGGVGDCRARLVLGSIFN